MKRLSPLLLCFLAACGSDDRSTAKQAEVREPQHQITVGMAPCDRSCLEGFIDSYLAALAANDPSRLPLSEYVAYSENNQVLKIGDGIWRTVTGLGKYRHYFADPETGQAAVMTVVEESGKQIIFNLRLAVAGREITEVEAMVIRSPAGAENIEKLGTPMPEFLESVPAAERVSRQELAATANKYLSGMENNDPGGNYSFFADDCDRIEHGIRTTNNEPAPIGHTTNTEFVTLTCREQFERGGLAFVTRIRDRRFVVIDEERQSVFGIVVLDHNGTIREIKLSNGNTSRLPPYFSTPRSLLVGEAWRVRRDKVFKIEMTLTEIPYGNRPAFFEEEAGWISYAGNSNTQTAAGAPCDKPCLQAAVNIFLEAMLSHDPDRLAMPAGVKYTENGQQLRPGDGLWGTLTGLGDFRLVLTDAETSTAGVYANIVETDVPALLMARLQVQGNQVAEIEVVVAREEFSGARGGTLTLFAPTLDSGYHPDSFSQTIPELLGQKTADDDTAQSLSAIVNRFYAGFINNDGGLAPLPAECQRRINGLPITHNDKAAAIDPEFPDFRPYSMSCAEQLDAGIFGNITLVRDRKEWIVDTETGLYMEVAILDVPSPVTTLQVAGTGEINMPQVTTGPYSLLVAQLFRIDSGEITNIETVQLPVPYGMNSGW